MSFGMIDAEIRSSDEAPLLGIGLGNSFDDVRVSKC